VIEYLRMFASLLRVSILGQIQYRASGAIWMIGAVVEPLIYLVVWSRVAEAQGGSVAGFGPRDFAAYYITYMFINHLTFSWVTEVFQYRIQYGQLASELLRPLHPIHGDVADNIAYKLVMLVVMAPAAGVLMLLFQPRFESEGWALACAPLAVVLGFATRFTCEWTLAQAAFFTTRTTAINQTYYALLVFLSGRVAPLAVLPGWLGAVATAAPFYWFVGFPVELALGRLSPADALRGFGMQMLWLGGMALVLRSAWRVSLRRFSAVGA
jgi:ABC-2 type transport system permease protein